MRLSIQFIAQRGKHFWIDKFLERQSLGQLAHVIN